MAHEVCASSVGEEVEVGLPVGVREAIEGLSGDRFAEAKLENIVKLGIDSLKVNAMTIVVQLTPELEEILRDRAHSEGQDVTIVASELLSQVLLTDKKRLAETEELQSRALEDLLRKFEHQYQMDSRSFYQKFQAGTIGDSADFFEWNTYYEMLHGSQVAV